LPRACPDRDRDRRGRSPGRDARARKGRPGRCPGAGRGSPSWAPLREDGLPPGPDSSSVASACACRCLTRATRPFPGEPPAFMSALVTEHIALQSISRAPPGRVFVSGLGVSCRSRSEHNLSGHCAPPSAPMPSSRSSTSPRPGSVCRVQRALRPGPGSIPRITQRRKRPLRQTMTRMGEAHFACSLVRAPWQSPRKPGRR
jgi:hypothetical protein